jgi:hypothetical protein
MTKQNPALFVWISSVGGIVEFNNNWINIEH